ncbi:MAG TPA: NAD(P)H-hydrate epimerase [Gemmatales bacterium]|nr:NAD(P)H-hydrate epimerase [Gemmatales bacterium]HMP59262.1 NAD(P)H-hydrate epimerase [Gemmatales bacterium]
MVASAQPTLTRAAVRHLDQRAIAEYGIPGIVLMENAGRGATELLLAQQPRGPVVICCGKGNNGGDGLVMARHLDRHRIPVELLLFAEPDAVVGDARINLQIVQRMRLSLHPLPRPAGELGTVRSLLARADWIVDALFGTGLDGPIQPPLADVIDLMNQSPGGRFAVDLPSGLDANSGQPLGPTVRANLTATFVAWKRGFLSPGAAAWTGAVHVIDIGAPRQLVEEMLAADQAPT